MKTLIALLALLTLAGCATTPREPSPNLTLLKKECVAWHDSGAYAAAFARAAAPAGKALQESIRDGLPARPAVVFDIDETLLSNWPYLVSHQFAIDPKSFAEWGRRERAAALAPTKAVFDQAIAAGIPVFLITGRGENLRAATIADLKEAGFHGWTGLFLKPANYKDKSAIPYKSGIRRQLAAQGYDILINVGDQESDLAGGYARRTFKLPNPFYYIP